jgi:uncharacterized repeat protein (TIGR01451 family)
MLNKLFCRWFSSPVKLARQLRWRPLLEYLETRTVPSNTGMTGGGQPFDNTQPSLPLHYIIAEQGIFPSRDNGPGAGSEQMLGEVRLFAGNFAPGGWAFCDGQVLSIAQNTALFSLLGTTYGGNGQSTFALPDLRGRVAVEAGQGTGLTNRVLGEDFGAENVTLTLSQLPVHDHTLPTPPSSTTGVAGGNQPFDNTQPSLGIHYIIATQGVLNDIGEIRLFAGNFAPGGWAFADGQILSTSQYSALFGVLGTTYGGDGMTTFALPDLRGRVPVEAGQGTGLTNRSLSAKFGAETHTLTVAEMPAHNHTLPGGGVTGTTGGSLPFDNTQPSLAIHYILATVGIFPSTGGTPAATDPILGEVRPFAGTVAPQGWVFADGQVLPISQYQALFSLLGTTYGGDGMSNFALPDLRGRAAVEAGTGAGLTARTLGTGFGAESLALTVSQIPAHDHTLTPEADLVLTNTAAATANEGDNVTYNITITNSGNDATNSVLTDVLPASTAFVASANFSQGDSSNVSNGTLTINLGTITGEVTGTIVLTLSDEGTVANTVSVASDVDDPVPDNNSQTASTTLSETDTLNGSPATLTATEGTPLTDVQVASFTTTNSTNIEGDFTASIDWGDNTTTTGTVSGSAGSFTVMGSHTFTEDSSSAVAVTITDEGGNSIKVNSSADIAEADLVATGSGVTATEGVPLTDVDVATFTDTGSQDSFSSFTATIDWGDNSSSTATISGGAGEYQVSGDHTYKEDGNYPIKVKITETGVTGGTASTSTTAIVAEAMVLSGADFSGHEFTPLTNQLVATFTNGNNSEDGSAFGASIDWGDNSSSTGSIVPTGTGYEVHGSHTYTDEKVPYKVTVTVTDDSISTTATANASIHEQLMPDSTAGSFINRFVSEVYRDLLHRQVDQHGLDGWSNAMQAMLSQGLSLSVAENNVIQQIELDPLHEYLNDLVAGMYQQYLGRAEGASDLNTPTNFANMIAASQAAYPQGLTYGTTAVRAAFLSSPEYLIKHGNTKAGFVDALYLDALGRSSAGDTGAAQFLANLTGGTQSRQDVATAVLLSDEGTKYQVSTFYFELLGRLPTASDLPYSTVLAQGLHAGTPEGITIAKIMADPGQEYFNSAGA